MISATRKLIKDTLNSNNHIKEVVHGASLTFFAKVIGFLAGLGTSLIVARYYGSEMVGILAIIYAVLEICMVFSLMGTEVAVLRLVPEYLQKYSVHSVGCLHKKMMIIVVTLSIITSCMLMLLSPFLCQNILHNTSMHFFIILTAIFIIIKSVYILNIQTIWGLQKVKIYAFMHSFPFVLNFLIITLLTFLFYRDNNPVYAFFLHILITSLILFFLVIYLIGTTKSSYSREYNVSFKSIISLSFPMFLTSAVFVVLYQADTLMLGIFRTEAEVGVYAIALKLAVLTNFILGSVQTISAPKFSQLYHSGDLEQLKIVAQGSTMISFWVSMPIILISLLFGNQILGLFGQEFKAGYVALLFLLVGQFVNVAAGGCGQFLGMTGHEKKLRNIIIFAGALNIVLNVILIPRYAVNGAAVATMVTLITWNVMASRYIKQQFGFWIAYIPWLKKCV